jgi:signal transduction histidine kinase/ActR/RegA family two-component response regulator
MPALLSALAVEDEDGNLVMTNSTLFDVTERKRLEQQLRQSQKLEAVGRLAGGVAHDFNNLLTAILGYCDLGLESLDRQDPLYEQIDEVRKAANRAAALTGQLLAFSRKQILRTRVLDLNSVVADMENMLQRLIGEDIELRTARGDQLGRVKADPGQMEQVIMNLAVNARDAMPQGGKLTIETSNVDLNPVSLSGQETAQSTRFVMMAVSDTGHGMDEETKARIFEPFFTTKETGKGTGLGLSTVYGIIKQSGGNISVYSEAGRGTSFKIYLPRVEEEAEVKVVRAAESAVGQGSGTILLVEDEAVVRKLACVILSNSGYTVLEAAGGGEALLQSERHAGKIDLLITDVVMPQMSGPQLAERLAALRPEMKVIYMSGYTDDAILHHGILEEGVHFVQKPFTRDILLRKGAAGCQPAGSSNFHPFRVSTGWQPVVHLRLLGKVGEALDDAG